MDQLYCIVAAAGMGKRARLGYNKNYAMLGGVPILVRNLHQLAGVRGLCRVIVAVAQAEMDAAEAMLRQYAPRWFPELCWEVTAGGRERQDSVARALARIPEDAQWAAVHDGARPFAGPELFERVWAKARETGAAVAAIPCKDTVKVAGIDFTILPTPDEDYSVEIPAIGVVYRHMLGSKVHNILPSIAYIDAEIADMERYQQEGYGLILTSHYVPEGQEAVTEKLRYLRKVKELAGQSKDKADFIRQVKANFPTYEGENYLEMSASALFGNK